jgi:hypothetical protein
MNSPDRKFVRESVHLAIIYVVSFLSLSFWLSLHTYASAEYAYADVPSDSNPPKKLAKPAVLEVHPDEGIRLSDPAKKTLGLGLMTLTSTSIHTIPKSSLVYFQDKIGIYRFKNNFYKLIPVSIKSVNNQTNSAMIYSPELNPNEQIVIQGVPLLRVTEMEAFSTEGG